MGAYDDIGIPVKGQKISSGAYGIKVRNAIIDLDRRVSSVDTSTGTGKAFSTSSVTIATTTETAALTITGMVFKAGLAYEAVMRMGLQTASNTPVIFCNARVRKFNATPASGADWGEYFRFTGNNGVAGTAPQSALGSIFLLNNTAADITSDVNLTVQSSVAVANAITIFANTVSPRFFTIKPAGFAADYVGMGVQVS
jgi:hypothetical protein